MQRTITLTNGRIKWILLYTLWAIYALRCAFRCANHEDIAQKYAVDYFSICAFFLVVVFPVLLISAYLILRRCGGMKREVALTEADTIRMRSIHRWGFMLPHLVIIYRQYKMRDCPISCAVAVFVLVQFVMLMFCHNDFIDGALFSIAILHAPIINLWYCIRDTKIVKKLKTFTSLRITNDE